MIAVDTNILVYAHREDSPWHDRAAEVITRLAEGRAPWAIPWPCVHEFLAIVTHPRVYSPPSPIQTALDFLSELRLAPSLTLLAEGGPYWERVVALLTAARAHGPKVHDARIAALCLVGGVDELLTADRDFGRFPELRVRNPLVG
ncbi:MAG: TA system VapC family ribonuclease toxin [Myxococcota bacterium]